MIPKRKATRQDTLLQPKLQPKLLELALKSARRLSGLVEGHPGNIVCMSQLEKNEADFWM